MKIRLIIIALAICVIATPAMADMYEMDTTTAAAMLQIGSVSTGDEGGLEYVGYNDGQSAGDEIWGPTWNSYDADTMIYAVGFSGFLKDLDDDGDAILRIGLSTPSLPSDDYTGFMLPIANDNDDVWQYRAYVTTTGTTYSAGDDGDWTTVYADTATTLIVDLGGAIDFSTVTGIGFDIRWNTSLNERKGDFFSTSVVPVPAAVILGILGLGVAGIKLRKYA